MGVHAKGRVRQSGLRWIGIALATLMLTGVVSNGQEGPEPVPLRVLIVGGGPEVSHNQVAIESNVRYVGKLLPKGSRQTTLFADGDPKHDTVLYMDDLEAMSPEHRVLTLLMQGSDSDFNQTLQLRKPNLGASLDGPSKQESIATAFQKISQENDPLSRSLLIYFTGHGSPNNRDRDNNVYDLWGKGENLSVRELARQIGKLPETRPVAIVMVQCFSGAFGNLIFEGGDPSAPTTARDFAGFFATTADRVAAGCTPALNEADYHDFTSYFFAALTGRDRQGRTVLGADYDGDGHVGMNEAYCYTLIHDASIDVPVCTSDVFLRRFVPAKDEEVFQERYGRVLTWATAAQRAALEALSEDLHLTGENRLTTAHDHVFKPLTQEASQAHRQAIQRFRSLRQEQRKALYRRWPDLRIAEGIAYEKLRKEALTEIANGLKEGRWQDLLDAYADTVKTMNAEERADVAQAHELRFVRLAKSIILAHRLQQTGDADTKARYARLLESEGRTWLPFLAGQKAALAAH